MTVDPTIAIVFGSMLLALFASLMYAYWQQTFTYKTSKRAKQISSETLKVSELEELIRKVVAESTLPLDERLTNMEAKVRSLRSASGDEVMGRLSESDSEPLIKIPEERGETSAARSRRRPRG